MDSTTDSDFLLLLIQHGKVLNIVRDETAGEIANSVSMSYYVHKSMLSKIPVPFLAIVLLFVFQNCP